MTKPKTKPCPSCQAPNTCNRKTCSGCLGSLNIKEGLKKKQEQFKNINWTASVKKNRNASRVVNSAQLSVSKLHALGYQPILFLGQFDRKGRIVGDVITQIEPAEGAARDILMKMRKLYEHLLRKLQASPPAESSTPAAGPSSADNVDAGPVPDPEALNEEFILHLEPVPTSSLCQPPASSSLSLLPPASPSPSLLPPASSSPSLLPPASSSPSLLPPASSSPSLLPPASSSPSPHPASPSISTVYTSNLPIKKRTRKECRKHRTQKIFKYEEIVDRRVVNEKEEVKVKWKPCFNMVLWDDTWEPAQFYTQ
ncbi:Down syndrome cell adhesion molecule [Sarotherodon galilaeus]